MISSAAVSTTQWIEGFFNRFASTAHAIGAKLQSTLGFETLDKAAALDLATATPLTDLRQYINGNPGFRNLKI